MRIATLALFCLALIPVCATAHEVRPGYLELVETEVDTFAVTWKVPLFRDAPLYIRPVLPSGVEAMTPVTTRAVRGAELKKWSFRLEGGLAGQTVAIRDLDKTLTDVLVRVQWLDGSSHTTRLTPTNIEGTIPEKPTWRGVAASYFVLGVEHILGGIDHLLFVLALLLIVQGVRLLVETITAFTIAHSITLALATLGFVQVPSAPVEAIIALSIVFVAAEILHGRAGRPGLTGRYPWVVAFTFGLLHGFGFAGALADVGLPQSAIPLALLFFNVGVEAGQLLFVAGALVVLAVLVRIRVPWPEWSRAFPPYAIGSVAMFWVIQRVAAFWS